MIIDFNAIPERTAPCPHGGEGEFTAKTYADPQRRIVPCRIHPGASIGPHSHDTSEEILYVLYGNGIALCDGMEEPLYTDVCHICPKGSSHSIKNTGMTDLVLLTVITEQ